MAQSLVPVRSVQTLSPDALPWQVQAHALLDQAKYEAALHCFDQAAQLSPSADTYVSQAVCLIHLHRPQAALQACDRALSLEVCDPQAWLFRGVALHRLGRFGEAYACYSRLTPRQANRSQLSLAAYIFHWLSPLRGVTKRLAKGHYLRRWVH